MSEETSQIVRVESAPAVSWTADRIELVKRSVCPKGISTDEFSLFIEQCRRSGLDPLLKEAFCVPRRAKSGDNQWITKHEFQPSEAGMLARAERFPDYGGCMASAVYDSEECVLHTGRGEVEHSFNPAKRKGTIVGAWARIQRRGKLPVLVWVDFSGYVQQTPLWQKIPTTMIEKCARVAALRKAYPEAFGGMYVKEEMPAEEFPEPEPAPRAGPTGTTRPVLQRAAPEAVASTPVTATVVPPSSAPAKAPANVVAFGPYKGKAFADLSDDEVTETIDLGHEKLAEQPTARWAKAMAGNVRELEMEAELRCRVPTSGKATPTASTEADLLTADGIAAEADALTIGDIGGLAELKVRAMRLPAGSQAASVAQGAVEAASARLSGGKTMRQPGED